MTAEETVPSVTLKVTWRNAPKPHATAIWFQ